MMDTLHTKIEGELKWDGMGWVIPEREMRSILVAIIIQSIGGLVAKVANNSSYLLQDSHEIIRHHSPEFNGMGWVSHENTLYTLATKMEVFA